MSNEPESKIVHKGFGVGHMLFAFVGGAAAGAITALLTAPASGVETRAWIKSTGLKGRDRARYLPVAIKAAGVAAQEAFTEAMEEVAPPKKLETLHRHREPTHRHSVS